MSEKSAIAQLDLLGGALCLDFVNTVSNHKTNQPSEHLENYSDLVTWSRHAGIFGEDTVQALLLEATRHKPTATHTYQRAITLREAIYRIFTAIASGVSPQSTDIHLLNESLADALAHARVVATTSSFKWDWSTENALDRMLWSIARSAADLLTSDNLDRVRQCGDDECGWLFIDTSKNRSRRWCAMNDCGNRAKARRYYTRLHGMK